MRFTGPTYRPPYEASSLLLQVTVGCAHNKCIYCTMYADTKFCVEPLNQIEEDIIEARKIYGNGIKRVFLVNGDAFVLSANKLKDIANIIHKHFSNIEVITMYASINNIKSKTDEELKELKKLKIDELWVGVETGNKETLLYLNKGFTLDDTYTQLERLNKADIKHIDILMFGTGGTGNGSKHAKDTAQLINMVKPMAIATTTLGAFGESKLSKDVSEGVFKPATELEVLEEQKELISLIDIEVLYLGIHSINTVPFDARLPEDKEKAISFINKNIDKLDDEFLNSIQKRNSI